MSKFYRTILILCLFVGAFANAQQTKMTAVQVLDKVVSKMESAPSLSVTMILTVGSHAEHATLTVAKEKFTTKFGSMEVFYDGTTQWTVNSDDKEISLTEPTASELSETNPLAFMQNYKNKYTVSIVTSNATTYTIGMLAKDKSSYVRSANVVIDTKSWLPVSLTAQLANGQPLKIKIVSCNLGEALPLDKFRGNTKSYPGFETIDLR